MMSKIVLGLLALSTEKEMTFLMLFYMALAFVFFIALYGIARHGHYRDAVHLKDGRVIRGEIVQQMPGVSIKIQTRDKQVHTYRNEEIEKIVVENIAHRAV